MKSFIGAMTSKVTRMDKSSRTLARVMIVLQEC